MYVKAAVLAFAVFSSIAGWIDSGRLPSASVAGSDSLDNYTIDANRIRGQFLNERSLYSPRIQLAGDDQATRDAEFSFDRSGQIWEFEMDSGVVRVTFAVDVNHKVTISTVDQASSGGTWEDLPMGGLNGFHATTDRFDMHVYFVPNRQGECSVNLRDKRKTNNAMAYMLRTVGCHLVNAADPSAPQTKPDQAGDESDQFWHVGPLPGMASTKPVFGAPSSMDLNPAQHLAGQHWIFRLDGLPPFDVTFEASSGSSTHGIAKLSGNDYGIYAEWNSIGGSGFTVETDSHIATGWFDLNGNGQTMGCRGFLTRRSDKHLASWVACERM